MYGTIYKITCIETNKIYIGQTTKSIDKRLLEHFKVAERNRTYKSYLYNAMNTYDKAKFIIESIDFANDKEELNAKEIYWIKKLDTRNPSIGYNIQEGGTGGKIRSDDYILTQKQLDSLEYGRHLPASEKLKRRLSEIRTNVIVSDNTKEKLRNARKNQVFSEETRKKLSLAHKGKRIKPKTDLQKDIAREISSNRVHIHKDNINKNPKQSELQKYLDLGWQLGYIYNK